jgi:hypothetical protein
VAGVVTEAQAEQRRALQVLVSELEELGDYQFVVDAADFGIGHADEALEVPRAGAADARLLGRWQAKIGGISGCRLA